MSMTINTLLWLIPLLILPVSWLFYKYMPFRKQRYILYAVALTVAFVLDIFNVSFRFNGAGVAVRMTVCFMLAEYFWNIRRIAGGMVFKLLVIAFMCGYGAYHWHWLAAGPGYGLALWKPTVLSTFKEDVSEYRVLDVKQFDARHPDREIKLYRQIGTTSFEKLIKGYRPPEGYANTAYICKWSITPQGVRLDLYDNDRIDWTLGEGF